ncbi:hypothetical protein BDW74DRAFT_156201 [Aspergillus multicolor]|uniref:uncharacterized protein n=1 Tax=Aspergillus multicolor TaxID=41759 RepID=UPI003CCDD18F
MALPSIVTTLLSILLLSIWTGTALIFVGLDTFVSDTTTLHTIASTSLLTFLLCRLYVAFTSRDSTSLAHTLTTAYKSSRTGAITLLILSAAWLHQLYQRIIALTILTLFTGAFTVMRYLDAYAESRGLTTMTGADGVETPRSGIHALSKKLDLEELESELDMKLEIEKFFDIIPPSFLLCVGLLLWADLLGLGVYLLRVVYRAVQGVFGAYDPPASTTNAPAAGVRMVQPVQVDGMGSRAPGLAGSRPAVQATQGVMSAYGGTGGRELQGHVQNFGVPGYNDVSATQASPPIQNNAGSGFWISWG